MRNFIRWWDTLDRPERIVAMSVTAGGIVAIANSTAWAIATSYISHQKAKVAIAQAQAGLIASRHNHTPATSQPEAAPPLYDDVSQRALTAAE